MAKTIKNKAQGNNNQPQAQHNSKPVQKNQPTPKAQAQHQPPQVGNLTMPELVEIVHKVVDRQTSAIVASAAQAASEETAKRVLAEKQNNASAPAQKSSATANQASAPAPAQPAQAAPKATAKPAPQAKPAAQAAAPAQKPTIKTVTPESGNWRVETWYEITYRAQNGALVKGLISSFYNAMQASVNGKVRGVLVFTEGGEFQRVLEPHEVVKYDH